MTLIHFTHWIVVAVVAVLSLVLVTLAHFTQKAKTKRNYWQYIIKCKADIIVIEIHMDLK